MSDTVGYIFEGPGTVTFATYVAPVAGSEPVVSWGNDCGAIVGGVAFKASRKYHDVVTDHTIGHYDHYKIDEEISFTFTMQELSGTNMRISMDQATGVVTGAAPNWTIARDMGLRQLVAMKIVSLNQGYSIAGTINTLTIYAWRCVVIDVAEVSFKKDGEALLKVTVRGFVDPGIYSAGTAKDVKFVYSGG